MSRPRTGSDLQKVFENQKGMWAGVTDAPPGVTDPIGHRYADEEVVVARHIRILVVRGMGSLLAYVGVPQDHAIAGLDCDDIPPCVHGGFTFSGLGDGGMRAKGYWWYGWDYAHFDDRTFIGNIPASTRTWRVEEVDDAARQAAMEMEDLMTVAEAVRRKPRRLWDLEHLTDEEREALRRRLEDFVEGP